MPASPGTRFFWRGQQATGDSLVIFPLGAELSSVSDPSFHVFTCSFSDELLAEISESLSVSELDDLRGPHEAVRCHPIAIAGLRASLRTLCCQIRRDKGAIHDAGLIDAMRREVPSRILGAVLLAIKSIDRWAD